jgi:hypothetical protein
MSVTNYEVWAIDSAEAQAIVKRHHYLKRAASAMFAFGLFEGMNLIGVAIYGKPASPSLCVGICGEDESENVIELTRLWIEDGTPKNTESYFIGATLKLLPERFDIVVSYAEIGAGHTGVIYQATNWLYTGLSDRHIEWRLDGQSNKHSRHLFDEFGGIEGAKKHFGDRLQSHERGRKHRYIMFRGNKTRKKVLMSKLKYQILPYPKASQESILV